MNIFKTLRKPYLPILLASLVLVVSCTNDSTSNLNSIKKEFQISHKDFANRISRSIEKSSLISSKLSNIPYLGLKTSNKTNIDEILLEQKDDIINIVKEEFPEFIYSEENYKKEDFVSLLEVDELENKLEISELSNFEKEFLTKALSYTVSGEYEKLESLIEDYKFRLNFDSNLLNEEELERAGYLIYGLESIFISYNISTNKLLSSKDDCNVAGAALAGAMVGAVSGFIRGCWTGVFLGFNPGSVAAGCLGGMIVGMVGGAVSGAVGGAVQCELL